MARIDQEGGRSRARAWALIFLPDGESRELLRLEFVDLIVVGIVGPKIVTHG